jgi:hypothetical protein
MKILSIDDAFPWARAGALLCALSLASQACTGNQGTGGGPGSAGTTGGSGSGGSGGTGGVHTGAGGSTAGAVAVGGGGSGTAGSGGAAIAGSSGAQSGSGGSVGSAGASSQSDVVKRSNATFTFQHFPSETNASNVWNGQTTPGKQLTSTTFDTVVLENGYLKVTLLPSYGGRILSIVHKPTGRELLYQNPIGTPYLMLQDIFYYDYLVILGGIFPSFPEPEHGKYWNQPYQLELVSESPEAITMRMSRRDDQGLATGVPERYDVGRTDVLVELDVTLRAGRSSLQLDTKLTNTRTSPVPKFEYWTVTTLAPGSTPGHTAIPKNTRIIAKMDQVHLLESSWSWFGKAEERVSGEVFKWNNLSHFENWVEQGTAFANPRYQANWSGLINYDNDVGILCVSDPVLVPGLKLWTFGKDSVNTDTKDSTQWLRPTIEMWHGITPEFWSRAMMTAGEVRKWSDSYLPTLGLKEVTAASEYGALSLSRSTSGTDTVLGALATLTVPNQTLKAILRLDGTVLVEKDVVAEAAKANTLEVRVATSAISAGAVFEAEFVQSGRSLLLGRTVLK